MSQPPGFELTWKALHSRAAAAAAAGDAQQAVQLYSQALATLRQGGSQQERDRNVTLLVAATARAMIARKPGGWKEALDYLHTEEEQQQATMVSSGFWK
jgi:hypothetical protein